MGTSNHSYDKHEVLLSLPGTVLGVEGEQALVELYAPDETFEAYIDRGLLTAFRPEVEHERGDELTVEVVRADNPTNDKPNQLVITEYVTSAELVMTELEKLLKRREL